MVLSSSMAEPQVSPSKVDPNASAERSGGPTRSAIPSRTWAVSHPGSLGLIVVAAFIVICAGVKMAAPILSPVVLGVYIAIVNTPLVVWLLKHRVPLTLTVAFAVGFNAIVLGAFSTLLLASLGELSGRLPKYVHLLQVADSKISGWLRPWGAESTLREVLDPVAAFGLVAGVVGDLAGLIWDMTIALIIAAFLLLRFAGPPGDDGVPRFTARARVKRAMGEVNRYIFIKTATSMATGLLIGLWCWACGAELPVLFGLLAFILNYIPNLGSIIAAVPAIGLGLLENGIEQAVLLTLGYVVVNTLIGNIIEPRIMGRALGLWPLVVLLSVIFWGWTLGLVGAVLSALLTLVVKMLLLATEDLRPVGLVLGPRVKPKPIEAQQEDLLEETMPQTLRTPRSER